MKILRPFMPLSCALAAWLAGPGAGAQTAQPAAAAVGPLPTLINYDIPNYALSPLPQIQPDGTVKGGLRKFVDAVAGLTLGNTNLLGQYLPLGVADTKTYPGSDYYEIALVDYREQMHSDLPQQGTLVRGYVQIYPPGSGTAGTPLTYVDTKNPITVPVNGVATQVYAIDKPHYLGPVILATKGRPTRIKFYNLLGAGKAGDLFIPVDTTIMGAGEGGWALAKDPLTGAWGQQYFDALSNSFSQNRATIHLHGGNTPWISDGTPHQWTIPVGDTLSPLVKGVSSQDVPDMPPTDRGTMTFYYPNQQSGRLMFYHDHSYGTTRVNVYAGEAAGYLLVDPDERSLTDGKTAPIPAMAAGVNELALVIQDKTFVWGNSGAAPTGTYADDPTWLGLFPNTKNGDFWFPHVYMPAQNGLGGGDNPMGRWDYQPYLEGVPVAAGFPATTSIVPESFMDTMLVNGTAYPVLNVKPEPYRWRILDACNDRFVNLSMWLAEPVSVAVTVGGSGYDPLNAPPVRLTATIAGAVADIPGLAATATVDPISHAVSSIAVTGEPTTPFSGPVSVVIAGPSGTPGQQAVAIASSYTEVRHVPFNAVQQAAAANTPSAFPASWFSSYLDDRAGGVPDPAFAGPAFVQIGTEGGLLPSAVVIENQPINYSYPAAVGTAPPLPGNVLQHALFLAPAERADVMVDFAPFAGRTLILYSDSPAPVPSPDSRYDFYTGDPDQRAVGGAPTTLPGYGPNTRTIMQIKVSGSAIAGTLPRNYVNPGILAALNGADGKGGALAAVFKKTQDPVIVPQSIYTQASGWAPAGTPAPGASETVQLHDTTFTFTPTVPADFGNGVVWPPVDPTVKTVTVPLVPKCIMESWDPLGRLNSLLGTEVPGVDPLDTLHTNIVALSYIDPTTETVPDGQTQIWKLTHNGVDTHAIHFHLVNVQIINRVIWAGNIIALPEPNEVGWKDTVRMNPGEDIIVAAKAKTQDLPFKMPTSTRVLDVTRPLDSALGFSTTDPKTGTLGGTTVINALADFGWEYVWHCHILGHEESDMMRPLVMTVAGTAYWKDTTAPGITGSLIADLVTAAPLTAPASGWFRTPVSVRLVATDNRAGKGVTSIEYVLDKPGTLVPVGAPSPVAAPQSFTTDVTVKADGSHTLDFTASDADGNKSAPGSVAFKIDATKPTLSVITTPALNADGWVNANVTRFVLAAADPTSGLSSLGYSASIAGPARTAVTAGSTNLAAVGFPKTYTTAALAFPGNNGNGITANGSTVMSVTYTNLDAAGNLDQATLPVTINVDKAAPTVAFTVAKTYTGTGAAKRGNLTISGISAADNAGGSGFVGAKTGARTITIKVTDGTNPLFTAANIPVTGAASINVTCNLPVGKTYVVTGTVSDVAGNIGTKTAQGQF